jgi:hypothetical protein
MSVSPTRHTTAPLAILRFVLSVALIKLYTLFSLNFEVQDKVSRIANTIEEPKRAWLEE